MVCDKCGFEHNSRSVCPKCGARVVYVNEDYLRRRQEWEEAQKQGRKDALPPGIMHSTREEHRAAKQNTDKEIKTSKGEPETASLSFRVRKYLNVKAVKMFFQFLWGKVLGLKDIIVNWYRKRFMKRRGADNPVIRELKFDDSPDSLDESNLVVSHKIYKDYRKYYFIGGGALLLLIVGIIIIVNIVKNVDRSNVLYFDGKFAYLTDNQEKTLFGSMQGNITVISNDDGDCLAYDTACIYMYLDGETTEYAADAPKIITYNDDYDTVVYMEKGNTMFLHNGVATQLDMPRNAEYTSACVVSDEGNYFVLTICENNDTYSLYRGNTEGELQLIQKSDKDVEVHNLSDDGMVNYVEMTTAEYGIINERNIMQYDGEIRCLAENVNQYQWDLDTNGVYFTTDEDKMYYVTKDESRILVDEEVTGFVTNVLDETSVYYYKDGRCYTIVDDAPYYVCNMYREGCELIYDAKMSVTYYYDRGSMYIVHGKDENKYTLMSDGSFEFHASNNMMYILNADGEIVKISYDKKIIVDTVAENATEIISMEGVDGIAFLTDEGINILCDDDEKSVRIYETETLNKVIYSRKKFYLADKNDILWKISRDGSNAESLGNVQFYNFVN